MPRDGLAQMRREFEEICEHVRPDSAGHDASVLRDTIYQRLHCKIPPHKQLFAGMFSAISVWQRAYTSLLDHAVPHAGWDEFLDTEFTLRDKNGVKVAVPENAIVTRNPGGLTLSIPSLVMTGGREWLQWNSARQLPSNGIRLYVSVEAEHSFSVWLEIVRKLADSDMRCAAKVAASPEFSIRADSIVVYGDSSDLAGLVSLIEPVVQTAPAAPVCPGFAVPIRSGVSLALTDGATAFKESVGMTWSTRLAEAYLSDRSQTGEVFLELNRLYDENALRLRN